MDTQATRTAKAPRGRLAVTAAGGSTPAPKTRGMPSTALVVVAVCLVGVAIVAHAAATGRNTVFGHPVLVVLSGSMSPRAIRTGDLIVDDPVSGAAAQRLHVGQATTFSDGPGSSRYVTHRIDRSCPRARPGCSTARRVTRTEAPIRLCVPRVGT